MRKIFLLLLLFGLLRINGFAQTDENIVRKTDYLSFQTGFIVDGYNSLGIRTFFEYQKDLKKNWQFGISYEHSRHFGFFMTDQLYDLDSDLSQISLNGYYKLNLIKDRLFWTAGVGIGALHVNWDDNDGFGPTINASLTLNMRLTKRIYLEASPLIAFLPFNRVYYSPMNIALRNLFTGCLTKSCQTLQNSNSLSNLHFFLFDIFLPWFNF